MLNFSDNLRLFTYKVAYDKGSAPNPFYNVCTLAICKPRIRAYAKVGDIIVGVGCKEDSHRIVYCMVVDQVLTWDEYVDYCQKHLINRFPINDRYGDCIWTEKGKMEKYSPLISNDSVHGHNENSFYTDVIEGKNVLLGKTYWYFGCGDKYSITLPEDLKSISPRAQGHRVNVNTNYRKRFIEFFNEALIKNNIDLGLNGTPKD